jgi:copper transport protein
MRSSGPLALLLFTLLVPAAGAHATLASAEPPPNGHADEGLDVIVFRFTEDVERDYTSADLIDPQGESWAAGPVAFDPDARNVIRLPVRALPSGIYSASWRALSVDTHTTRGAFVFAIGDATLYPGQYEPLVDEMPAAEIARDGFARFTFYAGLFLALGAPLFALVVLRERPPRALFATAAAFGTIGTLGAFTGLLFLGQRIEMGLGAVATAPGRSFALRGALLALATIACALPLARPSRWRGAGAWAVGLAAAAALATSLGSHAAATRENTNLLIAADFVHLVMGAVWVGGVVAFLLVATGREEGDLARMIVRFSPLAIASVVLLLGTGVAASLVHIPCTTQGPLACAAALREEPYARLVALKLLLMLPLIGIGAYNQKRVGPRLARGGYRPGAFRRVLALEASIMTVVIVAAGVLAASPPPSADVAQGTQPLPPYFELDNTTRLSHVILHVAPNPVVVGVQEVTITVHPLGPRLPNATEVYLKVWGPGEGEPEELVQPEKITPNEWQVTDGLFTTEGTWNVLVIVQRPDEYARIVFQVPVGAPGSVGS